MSRIVLPRRSLWLLAGMLAVWGCGGAGGEAAARRSITAADLAADIVILASDEYEGRAPSSKGEELTIAFLKNEFEKLGLAPGNGDSYFQKVPLVALTSDPGSGMIVWGAGSTTRLSSRTEYVAWTKRVTRRIELDRSDLVFVGYGIVAPELDWNDYAGLDVKGKTVIMLVNDPGYATQDEALFNGNAMTYYGRWTYKFAEAAQQGAEGALIIHETGAAGYPWEVVRNSWTGPQFDLIAADDNLSRCAVEGWVTEEVARDLFRTAGKDFDALKAQAATPAFEALPMGLGISLTLTNTIRRSVSLNVLGLLPGSQRPDEVLIYMAHWDHFGKDESLDGDQIYNGALDNATGIAGLLELAEAFTTLSKKPARSILFLAVTAEEQGLLGSRHYASQPVYPLASTVAALNLDGLNIYGPMRDVTIIGYGNSELDDYVAAAARKQGRVVRPDPSMEKGYFYRSDHFSFAQQGVPALFLDHGIDHKKHGAEWTRQQVDEYTAERYHKPADEFDPDWDLEGAVDDLELLFTVGLRLGNQSDFPTWREGNEFRAIRDAMMESAVGGTE